jgi:hypothetical protein
MLLLFAIALNLINEVFIVLWDRLSCALTGGRSERVSIQDGISILLKFDKHDKLRRFLILRDLRKFPQLGSSDIEYAYGFRAASDWNVLVASVLRGPFKPLPYRFLWHKKGGRILYWNDTLQFSLSTEHVKAIDVVVQGYFRTST